MSRFFDCPKTKDVKTEVYAQTSRLPQKRKSKANRSVLRWLVFCPPAGLLMMWGERCTWKRALKSAVSLGFLCLVLLVVFSTIRVPEQKSGGVEMVSLYSSVELMGPTMEAGALPYEVYVPQYIPLKSVIAEPTPTPVPYYVWCNDGGRYYHVKSCQYVRKSAPKTPKATLIQAVDAGFTPCKTCKPPKIQDIYGLGY